jgi:PAS domain S-box-containing protein
MQNVPVSIIATDMNSCINFMNSYSQSLTGWTEHEARGLKINKVIVQKASDKEKSFIVTCKDREINVDDLVIALTDEDNNKLGFMHILRDASVSFS